MRVAFKPAIILALLLAAIAMTALSAFFFTRLDQVVHGDLYRYGLQFNYEWAGRYWSYSRLMMSCLAIAMLVTGISIGFNLFYTRTGSTGSKFVCCLLLIMGIAIIGFSVFFFSRLDYIVNNDLYTYGLQFSHVWVEQYWTLTRLMMTFLGFAVAATTISIVLILAGLDARETQLSLSARAIFELDPRKLIPSVLFFVGGLALAFSIEYASSILAFIGLGLVLWGGILYYIRPEKYVKETLVDATMLPSLANLNQIIMELGYQGKAVYLPPKYLKKFESSKVYISAQKDKKLPLPEEISKEGDKVFLKNSEGMIITPPGTDLTRLFEKILGTSFTKVDLQYLEENIPRLLIEDLEIAQNVEIGTENSRIYIKIEGSTFNNLCNEAKKLSNINGSLGCPLCSAIACALTKATRKPITIEKEEEYQDGKTMKINFNVLED